MRPAVQGTRAPAQRLIAAAPPRRPRRRRRGLLVLGVLLVLGAAAYGGILGRQVWGAADAGRAACADGVTTLTVRHLSDLTSERLAGAAGDFQRAEQSFA